MKKRKGFTLVELLIVIAIIALLATLVIVSLRSAQEKARDAKRVADVKQIQSAAELYYSDNNNYPAPNPNTWAQLALDLDTYLSGLPVDPNNSATSYYGYYYPTAVGGAPDEYVIQALLEDSGHIAIQQVTQYADYGGVGGPWATETTINGTLSSGTYTMNDPIVCDGSQYCISE